MNLEEFHRLICDAFAMDIHHPVLWFGTKATFAEVSYQEWALEELEAYMKSRLPAHICKPVDDYISIAHEFWGLMDQYSKLTSNPISCFTVARAATESVIEVLTAMA